MQRKLISYVLILLGLAFLAYPKASVAYRVHRQQKLIEQWQESLAAVDMGPEEGGRYL